jgi:gluconate 5-dehydrogenase
MLPRVMPSTEASSGRIARHTIHWVASAISFKRYSSSVFINPNSPEFRTHSRAVAKKAMIGAKYGRIINIASMYGLVGNKIAGSAPYHAAKGGVVNMTRALAAEWGKYNITVNSICPGYFYTDLTRDTLNSDFFQQNAKTMIPEERYGEEGELDSAAIFLASPASSYVTGVNLAVDGGYTAM